MDTLHFLYGLLFLYAIYLWKRPNDWLVILPTFIVLVDFTPWTGRFLFNELDLFLALTIIVSGLSKKLQLPDKRAVLFLVLVVAAFALPTIINVSSLPHDEGYISNPYYSYGYGLKVLKGFIYALCLSLLAYRDFLYSSKQMVARLCYGSWIASAALFFIILWERKTLIAFANFENWWTVASSFLDFTSSYRVTGFLSDMHTGGEAYDGIVLSLYFINLFSIIWFKEVVRKYLAFFSLTFVGYCILVGFTRATYAAVILGTLFYFVVLWRSKLFRIPLSRHEALFLVIIACLTFVVFKFGGFLSLAAIVFMLVMLATMSKLTIHFGIPRWQSLLLMLGITLFTIAVTAYQHYTSKWIEQSTLGLLLLVLAQGVSALIFITLLQRNGISIFKSINLAFVTVVVCLVFGTYQFNARMGSVFSDIFTRFAHWQTVLDSSKDSMGAQLIGNGMGSFPYNYVLSAPSLLEDVGSFQIEQEQLILGYGGDLTFSQRVVLPQDTAIEMTFDAVSEGDQSAKLEVKLCQRNIIYASNFSANCHRELVDVKGDVASAKKHLTLQLDSLYRPSLPVLDWPWSISVANKSKGQIVYVDNIELVGSDSGKRLLLNGDFSDGMSHWFFYNDYEHLPWHIKNLYLAIYYQAGICGLALFIWLLWRMYSRIPENKAESQLLMSIWALTIAFLVFGLVGDPVDSARATSLLVSLVFLGYLIASASQTYQSSWIANKRVLVTSLSICAVGMIAISLIFRFIYQKPISEIGTIIPYSKEHSSRTIKRVFSDRVQTEVSHEIWQGAAIGPQKISDTTFSSQTYGVKHHVSNESMFKEALRKVKLGDTIIVGPGKYYFSGHALNLNVAGEKGRPITITATTYGDVIFNFDLVEGFNVTAPFWQIENLIIHGMCKSDSKCEHAMHISGKASHFIFNNGLVKNFNAPIKVNKKDGIVPDHGVILRSAFYNDNVRNTASPVTLIDIVAASHWRISQSYIADFAKGKGDLTSYGMFYKGAGNDNIFERNIVNCEWRHQGGNRVGASLGGGGTGQAFCRDGRCAAEQFNSVIRNNIVMNCPEDVGIYINKGQHSTLNNNLVFNTRGIDIRFQQSSVKLFNNIIDGRVLTRGGASVESFSNLNSLTNALMLESEAKKVYDGIYRGDFSLSSIERVLSVEPEELHKAGQGICGGLHKESRLPQVGPFASSGQTECKAGFGFLNVLSSE